MRLGLYSFEIPLNSPLILKGNPISTRKGWILRLQKENEIRLAEASPLPFFSTESFEEVKKQLFSLFLEGKKLGPLFPSLRFALSSLSHPPCPLFSLPFAKLLLPHETKVETGCLKIKYRPPICSFIEWLKQVQKKIPKAKIRLDINQKWGLEEGLFFAKNFTKKDFLYLEEPFLSKEALFQFSEKTDFPLALDESLLSENPEDFFSLPSLKALVIKPTLLGEIPSSWRKNTKKFDLVFSSSFESSVGLYQIARLAKRTQAPLPPMGLDTFRIFSTDTLKKPPKKKVKRLYFFPEELNTEELCHHFTVPLNLPAKKLLHL